MPPTPASTSIPAPNPTPTLLILIASTSTPGRLNRFWLWLSHIIDTIVSPLRSLSRRDQRQQLLHFGLFCPRRLQYFQIRFVFSSLNKHRREAKEVFQANTTRSKVFEMQTRMFVNLSTDQKDQIVGRFYAVLGLCIVVGNELSRIHQPVFFKSEKHRRNAPSNPRCPPENTLARHKKRYVYMNTLSFEAPTTRQTTPAASHRGRPARTAFP